jgi:hypothetical protein
VSRFSDSPIVEFFAKVLCGVIAIYLFFDWLVMLHSSWHARMCFPKEEIIEYFIFTDITYNILSERCNR